MLTDTELKATRDLIASWDQPIPPVPQDWKDTAFKSFDAEQRQRILFEFGYFLSVGASSCLTFHEVLNDPNTEFAGNYLLSLSISLLKEALDEA